MFVAGKQVKGGLSPPGTEGLASMEWVTAGRRNESGRAW